MHSKTPLVALLALVASIALLQSASAFGASQRTSTASAEVMDPLQVEILMELTVTYPELLNLTEGAWNNESLSADGCDPGLPFIGACNGSGWVTDLIFDSSVLVGPFPESLYKMEALQNLQISTDTITGTLPASWSALTSLQSLYVYEQSVSGPIPASWSAMTSLRNLFVTWLPSSPVVTWASGCLPNSALLSVQFENLDLGTNGALPADLFTTDTINNIVINNITFNGNLAPLFNNAHAPLAQVHLYANPSVATLPATDALPSDMTGLSLTSIDLANLPMQGPLPSTLSASLARLSLYNFPRLASTLSTGIFGDRATSTNIVLSKMPLVTGNIPSIGRYINPLVLDRLGLTGTFSASLLSTTTLRKLQITNMPNMTRHSLPEAPESCFTSSLNVYVTFSHFGLDMALFQLAPVKTNERR